MGNHKCVETRSQLCGLGSLLPGFMDQIQIIRFSQELCLLARPYRWPPHCILKMNSKKWKKSNPWLTLKNTLSVMVPCSRTPRQRRCHAGWSWPSARLASSLQWCCPCWSNRGRLGEAKSYSKLYTVRAWALDRTLLSPPIPWAIARRKVSIRLERAEPKYELWSPWNQSPGLSALIHCLPL